VVRRVRSTYRGASLQPLPDAEKEARRLARLYGQARTRLYVGDRAREDRIKAGAGAARTLHFATHGILDDRSPLYSHLLLASSEGRRDEDGLLEAWEMMTLRLDAELAVLSACETARGRVSAGEGMIGMTWALFVAGCPTTVASQWKVESRSTSRLMVGFHRKLRAGRGKAAALREAQLALLREQSYRHPFYWAGFALYGDGR
jgi:CHAT domain-containing protein